MYMETVLVENVMDIVDPLRVMCKGDDHILSLSVNLIVDGQDHFDGICKMLAKYQDWDTVGPWQERIRYKYKDNNQTSVDESSGVHNRTVESRTVVKGRMAKLGSFAVHAVKMSDTVVSEPCVLPSEVVVDFCRSYRQGVWSFQVFKRWRSNTLKSVFSKMDTDFPENGATVTLCGLETYLDKHSTAYVSVSLLMKLAALGGQSEHALKLTKKKKKKKTK